MIKPVIKLLAIVGIFTSQIAMADYQGSPFLMGKVESGDLPPVNERLPKNPLIIDIESLGMQPGHYGGVISTAMAKSKDTRQMTVYGYARLVKYNRDYTLIADILESVDIQEGRIFTLKLRDGHKWSDGQPFTAEDFRYWWQDIANDKTLFPVGPPAALKLNGKFPTVDILDELTVRYSWSDANPNFLPLLAQASPRYIYAPSHYLKQFHQKHQNADALTQLVADNSTKNWSSLHTKKARAYKNTNPDLPSLQPWVVQPTSSKKRFTFNRNPFYHKIDKQGRQLPYVDQWVFNITEKKLIPLKAATGEVSLQSRYLKFKDISLLKQSEKKYGFKTYLWRNGKGAHLALYPNLNHKDPMWRAILRDVRFRRAISLGIDRYAINKILYYGMALDGQNTLLPTSPLYQENYRFNWAKQDIDQANILLNEMGMVEKNSRGIRLMPNGEPLEIIIETADTGTEQPDVLQLIADDWQKIGVKLYIKPTSHDVLIPRIFSGEAIMSIFGGWDNGMATADTAPEEQAPVHQDHYQWPKWGQYYETGGSSGEQIDIPEARQLFGLYKKWYASTDTDQRTAIWHEMLKIHSDNLFVIGIVSGTLQPVMVINGLHNVPTEGIWNWDPGAHFGIYSPDIFWFDEGVGDA